MSVTMDSHASSAFSTVDGERDAPAPDVLGMHVASLRLYEDFYRLANAESSSSRLLEIIARAKAVIHAPGAHSEHQVRRFACLHVPGLHAATVALMTLPLLSAQGYKTCVSLTCSGWGS